MVIGVLWGYLTFSSCASGQGGAIATVVGSGPIGGDNGGFSGDGGPATSARLNDPVGVVVDPSGNLFIADALNNRIRKVSTGGIITTVAGGGDPDDGLGDGGMATQAALDQPGAVAVDASGNLFIADTSHNRIRKVSANGIITTVAGNGTAGFSGDGGSATSASLAMCGGPTGMAVDASGNLFIADTCNNRIRKVSPNGIITTVAGSGPVGSGLDFNFSGDGGPATSAELNGPSGVAVDAAGNLFIVDQQNDRIREVSAANGVITTVVDAYGAEDPFVDDVQATSATVDYPAGVAVDASGDLFIADTGNVRIREVVASSGIILTVAGNGSAGFSGDGGPATSAWLARPLGVTVDAVGNFFIADSGNQRIRRVSAYVFFPPAISSNGVAAINATITGIQSGEWASIYGAFLATSTAAWTGNFPTTLAGASVTVNGKPGYISFASPTQINFQVPDNIGSGSVPVVVTTPGGMASSTVTAWPEFPTFLLLDNKHVAGIIPRTDGSGAYGGGTYDILGPTGNSLGYPTVAAKAGDVVELFGTGFGPTTPAVPAGQAFSGAAPTTNPVELYFSETAVTSLFSGLVAAGLVQINVTIPPGLGTGDIQIRAIVGPTTSPEGITPEGVVISLQ